MIPAYAGPGVGAQQLTGSVGPVMLSIPSDGRRTVPASDVSPEGQHNDQGPAPMNLADPPR